ncbi:hypothetical protein ACHWQZ_G007687 [Mnemiopsis leidyi]
MQYSNTTEETEWVTTTWSRLPELIHPYPYIAPPNMLLAVFILLQNTVIFLDCYRDRARIARRLYLVIALTDMLSAVVELIRDGVALSCLREKFQIPAWTVVWYLSMGLSYYNCSISFNVILAVAKTINITRPFYRIERKTVDRLMIAVVVLWFMVGVADIVAIYESHKSAHSCYAQWILLFSYSYLGMGLMARYFKLSIINQAISYKITPYSIPMVIEYLVPCVVVFACTVVQMVYIKKSFSASSNPQQKLANHVNLTVFLVCVTFFFSVAAFCLYCFVPGNMNPAVEMVTRFSLPRIYAIIFPIIIILRKRSLRRRYVSLAKRLAYLPIYLCQQIWWMLTGRATTARRYSILSDGQPIYTSMAYNNYGSAG